MIMFFLSMIIRCAVVNSMLQSLLTPVSLYVFVVQTFGPGMLTVLMLAACPDDFNA